MHFRAPLKGAVVSPLSVSNRGRVTTLSKDQDHDDDEEEGVDDDRDDDHIGGGVDDDELQRFYWIIVIILILITISFFFAMTCFATRRFSDLILPPVLYLPHIRRLCFIAILCIKSLRMRIINDNDDDDNE